MFNYNSSKPMKKSNPPCAENIAQRALRNTNFRTTVWTGCYAQMTLMCIDKYFV